MRRVLLLWLSLAVATMGLGCATQPDATVAPDGGPLCAPGAGSAHGDFPCDVAAVLAARCFPCHRSPTKNKAPFSLLTWEDTQKPWGLLGLERWQRMAEVITPPNLPHMPPSSPNSPGGPQPQLDDAQRATLLRWFSTCAPPVAEGTGCDLTDGGTGDSNR